MKKAINSVTLSSWFLNVGTSRAVNVRAARIDVANLRTKEVYFKSNKANGA